MAINTSNIPSLLRPDLADVFSDLKTFPAQWKEIFKQETSQMAAEYDVEMQMLGLAQMKAQGASTAYSTMQQRYVTPYIHQYFSIGFIITRQAILDNQYKSEFPKSAKALRASLETVKNMQGAAVLNNAFNATFAMADGQPLCSTLHPVDGGVYSNTFPVPTQFNETSLKDALIGIRRFKNAAGLPIVTTATKLVVPTELLFESDIITESHFRTGTANNDINAIYNTKALPQGYTVNDFLTNPNAWFVMTDNAHAFKYYEREPLTIDMITDLDTDNLKVRALERYSFGCSDSRGVFGSQGA